MADSMPVAKHSFPNLFSPVLGGDHLTAIPSTLCMAVIAYRLHIQAVFFGVSQVMVIAVCLFSTVYTKTGDCFRQLAAARGVADGPMSDLNFFSFGSHAWYYTTVLHTY